MKNTAAAVIVLASMLSTSAWASDGSLSNRMSSGEDRIDDANARISAIQSTLYSEGLLRYKSDTTIHKRITRTNINVNKINDRVKSNTKKVNFLMDKFEKLNSRMDGITATSQAITAARPYLTDSQNGSIGMGMGMAGKEEAISIGYAQRLTTNWTANANIATASSDDAGLSVGFGTQYSW